MARSARARLALWYLALCIPSMAAASPLAGQDSRAAPAGLFVSGHSLTDRPYPDYLAALSKAAGAPVRWDVQNLPGSSLRDRAAGWAGVFRPGVSAASDAFRRVHEAGGARALILTEQHSLLQNLLENGTVNHLLAFDQQLAAANPAATTYLFSAWLGLGPGRIRAGGSPMNGAPHRPGSVWWRKPTPGWPRRAARAGCD